MNFLVIHSPLTSISNFSSEYSASSGSLQLEKSGPADSHKTGRPNEEQDELLCSELLSTADMHSCASAQPGLSGSWLEADRDALCCKAVSKPPSSRLLTRKVKDSEEFPYGWKLNYVLIFLVNLQIWKLIPLKYIMSLSLGLSVS